MVPRAERKTVERRRRNQEVLGKRMMERRGGRRKTVEREMALRGERREGREMGLAGRYGERV
jgi:hypothetical protein